MNAGNLFRSAHAFGASFLFTVDDHYSAHRAASDTSIAPEQVPLYQFDSVAELELPHGCRLVGIELLDAAVALPSFKHPPCAAYVLGPERGNLSDEMVARCDHLIKIPTTFCINVATAGAIVMYDRLLNLGRFGQRSTTALADGTAPPPHVHGKVKIRAQK